MRESVIRASAMGGLSADSATDPDALRLLGESLVAGTATPHGRACLRRAWTLAPSSPSILQTLERTEPGGQRLRRRRLLLERPLTSLFEVINESRRAGRSHLAESWIVRLLAMAPQHEGAETSWNALAALAHRRGEMNRARRALRRALVLAPDWDELHVNLSEVERLAEGTEAAVRLGRRAIGIGSDLAAAYTNLGLAMSAGQLEDGGLRCFRAALVIDPSRSASYVNLANALLLARSYVESAQWARRGLVLDNASSPLIMNLGYAQLCLGDLKRGFDAYELRLAQGNVASMN
jgi:tetratricopeptide (TPR) repeat protein